MTIERLHPSGDLLITDIRGKWGYCKMRYSGYTKKQAARLFRAKYPLTTKLCEA